ncbi:MAG: energy transducer TonB family protein [Phyllobacterium sp.]
MAGRPAAPGVSLIDWRELGRWALAGAVVVGVHAGAAWTIHNYQPEDVGGDIQTAVMIDMAPLPAPVVAEPVKEEPVVEPEPEPVEPEAVEEATAPVVEPEPESEPMEDAIEAEPEEAEPLDEQTEELVELPKVEVPLPVVRPQQEKPKKSVEKKIVRKVEKKVTTAKVDDKPREVRKPKAVASAMSARQAEKWQTRVQAYLARRINKAKGGTGTVTIRFSVSRSGEIVSSSIVGSSGMAELDQSVLDRLRRSSPVPSAPDEVAVSRQSFTVPFRIR